MDLRDLSDPDNIRLISTGPRLDPGECIASTYKHLHEPFHMKPIRCRLPSVMSVSENKGHLPVRCIIDIFAANFLPLFVLTQCTWTNSLDIEPLIVLC